MSLKRLILSLIVLVSTSTGEIGIPPSCRALGDIGSGWGGEKCRDSMVDVCLGVIEVGGKMEAVIRDAKEASYSLYSHLFPVIRGAISALDGCGISLFVTHLEYIMEDVWGRLFAMGECWVTALSMLFAFQYNDALFSIGRGLKEFMFYQEHAYSIN